MSRCWERRTMKRKRTEPDELDRRIIAKLQALAGPLGPEELERRMRATIEQLNARTDSEPTT
jgi:hypothetical protein